MATPPPTVGPPAAPGRSHPAGSVGCACPPHPTPATPRRREVLWTPGLQTLRTLRAFLPCALTAGAPRGALGGGTGGSFILTALACGSLLPRACRFPGSASRPDGKASSAARSLGSISPTSPSYPVSAAPLHPMREGPLAETTMPHALGTAGFSCSILGWFPLEPHRVLVSGFHPPTHTHTRRSLCLLPALPGRDPATSGARI